MIAGAAQRTQIVVVTHAAALMTALRETAPEVAEIALAKDFGETVVREAEAPLWTWPQR